MDGAGILQEPQQATAQQDLLNSNAPVKHHPTRKVTCRYFATKKGCRAGASCPFVHIASTADMTENDAAPSSNGRPSGTLARGTGRPLPDRSRVVSRPVPQQQLQNPRGFQISQIQKRFSARQDTRSAGGCVLAFDLRPSDPDFPFEMDALKCVVEVPEAFPKEAPSLRVRNAEMDRGFQINVERGFDAIWASMAQPTLLRSMNLLDRQLETLLTAKKPEMIKIVAPVRPPAQQPVPAAPRPTTPKPPPPPAPSAARRQEAEQTRMMEVQALENRLGRHPQFAKLGTTTFTLPLEPRKRTALPVELQAVKTVRLFVPASYNIDPCRIELVACEGASALAVADAFSRRAADHPETSLLGHVNYLSQNIHLMTTPAPTPASSAPGTSIPPTSSEQPPPVHDPAIIDTDRSHVKIIPRPPEWSADADSGTSDSDDYTGSSSDLEDIDEENEDDGKVTASDDKSHSTPYEKGIMVSFPGLELHNIELLELVSASLTVKCLRCKETQDVSNLVDSSHVHTNTASTSPIRTSVCKKCSNAFGLAFRKDLMHANSVRAGYFDLDGCTTADLLPSTFEPTCQACSTPYTAGVSAVRGASALAICRACHSRMSFRIADTKFLHVGAASSAAALAAASMPRKKKPKEALGIVAGQELPRRGRCTHYAKSYRWFRFSCCAKVFACDKCHDAEADHLNEFASRMLCGFCSREQPFHPETCRFCHVALTGRTGSGFWEGGKGTRDKARMSRKDPRKYKRRGGSVVGKSGGS